MESGLNETFYEITTPGFDFEFDFEYFCPEGTYNKLSHVSGITSAFGISVTISTLLAILFHRRLRKKHLIFAFNIVLADCVLDVFMFLDYIIWINYLQPESWGRTFVITHQASHFVSLASIFLVAVDQLILFKFDPFGVKNILTKSHRIIICILTWVIMMGVAVCILEFCHDNNTVRFYVCTILFLLTCFCYILVYRTIAGTHFSVSLLLEERRKENKRVLRTYALILGTTLVLFTLPDLTLFVKFDGIRSEYHSICFYLGWFIMQNINSMANSLIYWWRLREFRSIFPRKTIMTIMTIGRGL